MKTNSSIILKDDTSLGRSIDNLGIITNGTATIGEYLVADSNGELTKRVKATFMGSQIYVTIQHAEELPVGTVIHCRYPDVMFDVNGTRYLWRGNTDYMDDVYIVIDESGCRCSGIAEDGHITGEFFSKPSGTFNLRLYCDTNWMNIITID